MAFALSGGRRVQLASRKKKVVSYQLSVVRSGMSGHPLRTDNLATDNWQLPGAVAQLGERLICIQEVAGSIPTSSTRVTGL